MLPKHEIKEYFLHNLWKNIIQESWQTAYEKRWRLKDWVISPKWEIYIILPHFKWHQGPGNLLEEEAEQI